MRNLMTTWVDIWKTKLYTDKVTGKGKTEKSAQPGAKKKSNKERQQARRNAAKTQKEKEVDEPVDPETQKILAEFDQEFVTEEFNFLVNDIHPYVNARTVMVFLILEKYEDEPDLINYLLQYILFTHFMPPHVHWALVTFAKEIVNTERASDLVPWMNCSDVDWHAIRETFRHMLDTNVYKEGSRTTRYQANFPLTATKNAIGKWREGDSVIPKEEIVMKVLDHMTDELTECYMAKANSDPKGLREELQRRGISGQASKAEVRKICRELATSRANMEARATVSVEAPAWDSTLLEINHVEKKLGILLEPGMLQDLVPSLAESSQGSYLGLFGAAPWEEEEEVFRAISKIVEEAHSGDKDDDLGPGWRHNFFTFDVSAKRQTHQGSGLDCAFAALDGWCHPWRADGIFGLPPEPKEFHDWVRFLFDQVRQAVLFLKGVKSFQVRVAAGDINALLEETAWDVEDDATATGFQRGFDIIMLSNIPDYEGFLRMFLRSIPALNPTNANAYVLHTVTMNRTMWSCLDEAVRGSSYMSLRDIQCFLGVSHAFGGIWDSVCWRRYEKAEKIRLRGVTQNKFQQCMDSVFVNLLCPGLQDPRASIRASQPGNVSLFFQVLACVKVPKDWVKNYVDTKFGWIFDSKLASSFKTTAKVAVTNPPHALEHYETELPLDLSKFSSDLRAVASAWLPFVHEDYRFSSFDKVMMYRIAGLKYTGMEHHQGGGMTGLRASITKQTISIVFLNANCV